MNDSNTFHNHTQYTFKQQSIFVQSWVYTKAFSPDASLSILLELDPQSNVLLSLHSWTIETACLIWLQSAENILFVMASSGHSYSFSTGSLFTTNSEVRRMIHPFPTDRKSKTGHTLSTKDKLHEVTEMTKHTILPLNRAGQQSLQHEPIHHLLQ